ncbi:hypothetical protein ACRALDRAFT_2058294 [Sodiomyces alcalophilus JCM 7366]|uniref:uncharacterized protein n=1 Tax=Sodiomyces alcalophilus JCM 7366 TaxID=591952 RepID=UPI0039B6D2CB
MPLVYYPLNSSLDTAGLSTTHGAMIARGAQGGEKDGDMTQQARPRYKAGWVYVLLMVENRQTVIARIVWRKSLGKYETIIADLIIIMTDDSALYLPTILPAVGPVC